MEEIEFSRWLFEGRLRQGKNVLPNGLNWQCYFAGSSKSHRENSISFIFLESPHQVDMKNVVKCWKDFLYYFPTLETYCVQDLQDPKQQNCRPQRPLRTTRTPFHPQLYRFSLNLRLHPQSDQKIVKITQWLCLLKHPCRPKEPI